MSIRVPKRLPNSKWVTLDKGDATRLLTLVPEFKPQTPASEVMKYTRLIDNGLFQQTGGGIHLLCDDDGINMLVDGIARLRGLQHADDDDATISLPVTFSPLADVDPKYVIGATNQGQVLAWDRYMRIHGVANAVDNATICRTHHLLTVGGKETFYARYGGYTNIERWEHWLTMDTELVNVARKAGRTVIKSTRIPTGQSGAMIYQAFTHSEELGNVSLAFFAKCIDAVTNPRNISPPGRLVRFMPKLCGVRINQRPPEMEAWQALMVAWHAFLTDTPISESDLEWAPEHSDEVALPFLPEGFEVSSLAA